MEMGDGRPSELDGVRLEPCWMKLAISLLKLQQYLSGWKLYRFINLAAGNYTVTQTNSEWIW